MSGVSIAIPSSCIGGQACYSLEQATTALHAVARACVYFGVDEIVVFDVTAAMAEPGAAKAAAVGPADAAVGAPKKVVFDEDGAAPAAAETAVREPSWEARTAADLLQHFVTPPHLRKQLFGDMRPFQRASKLPRLPGLPPADARVVSGIAVRRAGLKQRAGAKKSKKQRAHERSTPYVNLGWDHVFELADGQEVPVHSRVTIDLRTKKVADAVTSERAASPYIIRTVDTFSKLFTEAAAEGGYTSTLFVPAQQFTTQAASGITPWTGPVGSPDKVAGKTLLVFGRWQEISAAVQLDTDIGVEPHLLFDGLLAGHEQLRIEDAVMIALAKADAKAG